MCKKTEPQLSLDGWVEKREATQKRLPAERTPSAQENVLPIKGQWKFHPMYQVWRNIKCRCFTPSNTDYHRYGGRGITVCDRWMNFELFVRDMGPRPSPAHSIDRIKTDGNYEPGNCRWATPKQQSDNTGRNHVLEFDGKRMNVTQWAAYLGVTTNVLFGRINMGWKTSEILTKPPTR